MDKFTVGDLFVWLAGGSLVVLFVWFFIVEPTKRSAECEAIYKEGTKNIPRNIDVRTHAPPFSDSCGYILSTYIKVK